MDYGSGKDVSGVVSGRKMAPGRGRRRRERGGGVLTSPAPNYSIETVGGAPDGDHRRSRTVAGRHAWPV